MSITENVIEITLKVVPVHRLGVPMVAEDTLESLVAAITKLGTVRKDFESRVMS